MTGPSITPRYYMSDRYCSYFHHTFFKEKLFLIYILFKKTIFFWKVLHFNLQTSYFGDGSMKKVTFYFTVCQHLHSYRYHIFSSRLSPSYIYRCHQYHDNFKILIIDIPVFFWSRNLSDSRLMGQSNLLLSQNLEEKKGTVTNPISDKRHKGTNVIIWQTS